jgi:hypothetical protein
MIYRGKIEYANIKKNEFRVSLMDFFDPSFNIIPEHYPKAKLALSNPLNAGIGVSIKEFLKVGVWVWCVLINNRPTKPVIIGFVDELIDTPNEALKDISGSVVYEINKTYGIIKKYEGENINLRIDGNVDLSLDGEGYKNLLTQLNDLKDIVFSFINKYNTHTQDTINAQGVKGKTFPIGGSSDLPDSSLSNPNSIPDLELAISRANLTAPTYVDPISGLHVSVLSARLVSNTALIQSEISTPSGDKESTDGSWNKVFKSK